MKLLPTVALVATTIVVAGQHTFADTSQNHPCDYICSTTYGNCPLYEFDALASVNEFEPVIIPPIPGEENDKGVTITPFTAQGREFNVTGYVTSLGGLHLKVGGGTSIRPNYNYRVKLESTNDIEYWYGVRNLECYLDAGSENSYPFADTLRLVELIW